MHGNFGLVSKACMSLIVRTWRSCETALSQGLDHEQSDELDPFTLLGLLVLIVLWTAVGPQ